MINGVRQARIALQSTRLYRGTANLQSYMHKDAPEEQLSEGEYNNREGANACALYGAIERTFLRTRKNKGGKCLGTARCRRELRGQA